MTLQNIFKYSFHYPQFSSYIMRKFTVFGNCPSFTKDNCKKISELQHMCTLTLRYISIKYQFVKSLYNSFNLCNMFCQVANSYLHFKDT